MKNTSISSTQKIDQKLKENGHIFDSKRSKIEFTQNRHFLMQNTSIPSTKTQKIYKNGHISMQNTQKMEIF